MLKTAWLIDSCGSKGARTEISLIKVVVPRLHTTVFNRAIQTFGAMGLSPDTPLATLWTWGRALQLIDGPDEVHLRTIGRQEIRKSRDTLGSGAAYLTNPERL